MFNLLQAAELILLNQSKKNLRAYALELESQRPSDMTSFNREIITFQQNKSKQLKTKPQSKSKSKSKPKPKPKPVPSSHSQSHALAASTVAPSATSPQIEDDNDNSDEEQDDAKNDDTNAVPPRSPSRTSPSSNKPRRRSSLGYSPSRNLDTPPKLQFGWLKHKTVKPSDVEPSAAAATTTTTTITTTSSSRDQSKKRSFATFQSQYKDQQQTLPSFTGPPTKKLRTALGAASVEVPFIEHKSIEEPDESHSSQSYEPATSESPAIPPTLLQIVC